MAEAYPTARDISAALSLLVEYESVVSSPREIVGDDIIRIMGPKNVKWRIRCGKTGNGGKYWSTAAFSSDSEKCVCYSTKALVNKLTDVYLIPRDELCVDSLPSLPGTEDGDAAMGGGDEDDDLGLDPLQVNHCI